MSLCLALYKKKHTKTDLKKLSEAPYFDVSRIRQRPEDEVVPKSRLRARPPLPTIDEMPDEEFIAAGTHIFSHSIAPSTRHRLERELDIELPFLDMEKPSSLMSHKELSEKLKKNAKLGKKESIGDLFNLLELVTELKFTVGWCDQREI